MTAVLHGESSGGSHPKWNYRTVVPGRAAVVAAAAGGFGFAICIACWWLAAAELGAARLPTPWDVGKSLFPMLWTSTALTAQGGPSGIGSALLYTTTHVVIAVAAGSLVGMCVGVAMGTVKLLNDLLTKVVEIIRTVPPLAAVPFFLVWFGVSATSRTLLVAFYTAVIVLIATRAAVKYTDPIYTRYASTLGADHLQHLRTIVVPAIIPRIAGGIRVALGLSWGLQIVAELLGSQSGIGRAIVLYENVQAVKEIIIAVIWISVIAYVVDKLYLVATSRLTRWVPRRV